VFAFKSGLNQGDAAKYGQATLQCVLSYSVFGMAVIDSKKK
jgi:hypothetical protein